MKITRNIKELQFRDEDYMMGVRYTNEGDPFREGVEFRFSHDSLSKPYNEKCFSCLMLEHDEIKQLRDKLTEFLGVLDD